MAVLLSPAVGIVVALEDQLCAIEVFGIVSPRVHHTTDRQHSGRWLMQGDGPAPLPRILWRSRRRCVSHVNYDLPKRINSGKEPEMGGEKAKPLPMRVIARGRGRHGLRWEARGGRPNERGVRGRIARMATWPWCAFGVWLGSDERRRAAAARGRGGDWGARVLGQSVEPQAREGIDGGIGSVDGPAAVRR